MPQLSSRFPDTFHGRIFFQVDVFVKNLRKFAYKNQAIFEIIFLLLYAFVQILLIISLIYYPIAYVVGFYTVIVFTLFAVHKIVMLSKMRQLENEINELKLEKDELTTHIKSLGEVYKNLRNSIMKSKNR